MLVAEMIEHERSYIFTHEGADKFLSNHGVEKGRPQQIRDCYLAKGLRVRSIGNHCVLTQKQGDKSKGYRLEDETEISSQAFNILAEKARLTIQKNRFNILVEDDRYAITMDFVEKPMKLAILEIEASDQISYPIPIDITSKLFKESLIECPRCAHSLFRRQIGICGGPSSGKSELAKILSHTLNTKFGANSFHVVEFATSFIQKYHKQPEFMDQFFIWYGQHEREANAEKADIVISDCPTFLSYIYMLLMRKFKFNTELAIYLSKIYKRVLFDIEKYTDLIFLEIKNYADNRIRFHSMAEALGIEERIRQFLQDHNIPHTVTNCDQSSKLLYELFYINY